ncbi:MAG TPA: PQQ-binding-like beta-propeller repeat protein, partial [Gaiellaceae bacterium]|nr:PQQ-binding-like beta-propeller repeat protein [Gaiellaceae bacterium]
MAVVTAFALLFLAAGASAAPRAKTAGNVGWASFGNTVDSNRYSPLTSVNRTNVSHLGRAFTIDLGKVVPGIKKGQQTYPIVVGNRMFITSGDDQVFGVNASTGDVLWHYAPNNLATFKNFGIVANRGVAYCAGRVFLLTLDMTIVALDPATGKQIARVPISRGVPGAQANYGYSETSAPICAGNRVIVGAAGSEYGARGFVMAFRATDLAPAWANPFWTIPPNNTEWRKAARIVGGGVVWTPPTVDPTTNTLYIGTGAATPPYYPSLRPGTDPRADSIIAINLANGQMKWWQQQLASNEWSYDTSQPPMVYTAKIGGQTRRVVSVATMEGVWFAYDAKTGSPIWARVKVIDNVEHPNLKPGKPVVVYPSSLGGLNYSPASFDPQTQYVYNAASETASVLVQQTSTEEERQALLAGDPFLGLANGDYGQYLRNGWKDYGSVSAINVATGKRVWKFDTPQPERGGPTTTAAGIGFVGGGDGNLRAFDVRTGKVLWKFQTGYQIADGPSVYSVNGVEYVAIGVGGTPTSSSGGTVASQVQVFSLNGSHAESPPPTIPKNAPLQQAQPAANVVLRRSAAGRSAAKVTGPAAIVVKPWNANTSNQQPVQGRVTVGGKPVAGAIMRIGGWVASSPTDAGGRFTYPVDTSTPGRHVAAVVGFARGTVGGRPLTSAQRSSLLGRTAGINVGYAVKGASAHVSGGNVVITGRLADTAGNPAPPVVLYSYELKGTITDAAGHPVKGAVVTTRTNDRQYWTQSRPSAANGSYASFLVAADQEGDNPVPMTVGVAVGNTSYAEPFGDAINFAHLSSATMNVSLPGGASLPKNVLQPTAIPGAIYQGLLVGVVSSHGGVIKPVSATWPTAQGSFRIVLPGSARGKTVAFWESPAQFFSASHEQPGGAVDLSIYPHSLSAHAPQGIA